MTTMTATDCSRNFSSVLDKLEFAKEPIEIVRNKHVVARMIPGVSVMSAREVLTDLFGILSSDEGEAWLKDCQQADKPLSDEMRDPWA
jgi:antitoxin (DNA-binding transcriptional repressor) of toxin-antitoxin stability system